MCFHCPRSALFICQGSVFPLPWIQVCQIHGAARLLWPPSLPAKLPRLAASAGRCARRTWRKCFEISWLKSSSGPYNTFFWACHLLELSAPKRYHMEQISFQTLSAHILWLKAKLNLATIATIAFIGNSFVVWVSSRISWLLLIYSY